MPLPPCELGTADTLAVSAITSTSGSAAAGGFTVTDDEGLSAGVSVSVTVKVKVSVVSAVSPEEAVNVGDLTAASDSATVPPAVCVHA